MIKIYKFFISLFSFSLIPFSFLSCEFLKKEEKFKTNLKELKSIYGTVIIDENFKYDKNQYSDQTFLINSWNEFNEKYLLKNKNEYELDKDTKINEEFFNNKRLIIVNSRKVFFSGSPVLKYTPEKLLEVNYNNEKNNLFIKIKNYEVKLKIPYADTYFSHGYYNWYIILNKDELNLNSKIKIKVKYVD